MQQNLFMKDSYFNLSGIARLYSLNNVDMIKLRKGRSVARCPEPRLPN